MLFLSKFIILTLVFCAKINYTTYYMRILILETTIFDSAKNAFSIFRVLKPLERVSAVIEILIIAFVVYKVLMWLKNTRAWGLLRGVVIIAVFAVIARLCNFDVILELLKRATYLVLFGLIIIFQDDIKAGLEHLGRQRVFSKLLPDINKFAKKTSEASIQEIAEAAFAMGKVKTGALIVIEQNVALEQSERTGIEINGDVTRQLLINIFEKNTPLHDGAVLIVGDIIKSATCYLPLSKSTSISKDLGTRHRAALGVSEVSDALTIVVSEETGHVSLCVNGRIEVINDEKELIRKMYNILYEKDEFEKR